MKFREIYTKNAPAREASDVMRYVILSAPDYHAGELESLRAVVEKQTDTLVSLIALLSDAQQTALVKDLAYGWGAVE